ncbi:RICIN domain-containing protein [Kitasatospora sp. MBT63]|uniref:RICIN domain-containing protein n=1 Tax=Kitasatospora sp. MBT63 TaxID=1444768 RepID=UPI000691FE87|nr:RICIN domain-containing protein [Kitasatospora sp. MBT63]
MPGSRPRPHRAASVIAAVLAAVLIAALSSLVGASPASAGTALCGRTDSVKVSGGKYVVQNNEWGDSIEQCIDVSDDGFKVTKGWHNVSTGGAPAAYPSIYAGCHYGNCSSGNGLPLQVSAFGNPQSSVDFSTADGQWDASYDIWFDTGANPSGQNNGEEMMIWANHAGPPSPFGSKVATVRIEGADWDVWYGRQNNGVAWNTVSYVRQQPTNAMTVSIKDFTDDSIGRGYLSPSWYMTSVQFGFEPWVGGPGLAVNSFSYEANGSGGGGTSGTVTGRQSGRCLDLKDWGTVDGTPVQLWDCGTGWNQKWTRTGGTLVNPQSGKCLDVAGGSTANGAKVQLWSCNGTGAQQWQFNANGTVVNPASGKCLDAGGSADGALLQIWDCYGGGTQANQVWALS